MWAGRNSFPVILAAGSQSYETTLIETEVVEECKGWIGQSVVIGGIATATVVSANIPLKLFKKTSSIGPLSAGALLVNDVTLFEPDLKEKKNWTKFKKNILVSLDGKSHETIPEAMGFQKNSGDNDEDPVLDTLEDN